MQCEKKTLMPVEGLHIFQNSYIILCNKTKMLILRLHSIHIPNEKEVVFINYLADIIQ